MNPTQIPEEAAHASEINDSSWLCDVLQKVESDIGKWPDWLRKAAGISEPWPDNPASVNEILADTLTEVAFSEQPAHASEPYKHEYADHLPETDAAAHASEQS